MSFSSTPDSRILTYSRRCCMKPHFHHLNLPRHEKIDAINYLQTFVASLNSTLAVQEPEWLGSSQIDAYGQQAVLLACPHFTGRTTSLKQEVTWVVFCTRCPMPVPCLNKTELCHRLHPTVHVKTKVFYCRESDQQWLGEANSRQDSSIRSGGLAGVRKAARVGGVTGG